MQIIKLDATESTNTYLRELAAKNELLDFTVVTTQNQTEGRGQLSAKWESENGKNLAISILKRNIDLSIDQSFLLSMCASLAILDSLRQLGIPNLSIKWPNDILSGNFKIGGILIENTILGSSIRSSIIGFGLNINQESFNNLPHAASLKQIVGLSFDIDAVFFSLIKNLKLQLSKPLGALTNQLFEDYHANLFRIGEFSSFMVPGDKIINGVIQGIANNGKLQVLLEQGNSKEFGLKEIQLQY